MSRAQRLLKLENNEEKTLLAAGIIFEESHTNRLIVRPTEPETPRKTSDSAFNGTSAHTPPTPPTPPPPPPPTFDLSAKPKAVDSNKEYLIEMLLDSTRTNGSTTSSTAATAEESAKPVLAIMPADSNSTTTTSSSRAASTSSGSRTMDMDVDLDQHRISNTLKLYTSSRTNHGYVGLVNQAMTCYLNSLLQALFMTPEFRNAMYKWEFDGQSETKSIPYQLQKLFLNMQVFGIECGHLIFTSPTGSHTL